jgi:predicted AlkP superfamily phosphohydrolase/phosphomutase
MFSERDETIVDYAPVSGLPKTGFFIPVSASKTQVQDILTSSFIVVRNNCEEACSQKLLSEVSESQKQEYRNNSKLGQNHLKTIVNDDLMKSFDSCIRRCFSIFI